MPKRFAIPIAVFAALFLVACELFIGYLFPSVDIGGSVYLIFLLIPFISIGAAIGVFVFLRSNKSPRNKAALALGLIIAAILVLLSAHPSNPNPWIEIYQYSVAFNRYPNNITYDDLAFGSDQQRVAAILKYQDSLPDKILVLQVEKWENRERYIIGKYWVEMKNNSMRNTDNCSLQEIDGSVLLITNPGNSNRLEYKMKRTSIKGLFFVGAGGLIPAEGATGNVTIGYFANDLKLHTGAEQLFYKILRLKR